VAQRQDAELLSECLVRLAISYAALPKGPAGVTAASIATIFRPYVQELIAQQDPACRQH
jgi:Bacterial Tetracyclin repressor,  C-terminal domain